MRDAVKSVMDPQTNPLSQIPPVQRFQFMVLLSMMWTAIFSASFGLWTWYGELIATHVVIVFLITLGSLVTRGVFRAANRTRSHRDHPASDGTARYDDIWGG